MPTLRGSSITSSSASSYTLAFSACTPAVPQAGDTAFLFVGGGYNASAAPAGWTTLDASVGSNWNGSVYAKTLTSGDISTGSVTVSMAGGFDTVLSLVVYQGAVNWRAATALRNGSGSTSVVLASASTVQAIDHVLLFGSNRANSTDTVDKGSLVTSVAGGTGGNASGVVNEYAPGAAGSFNATFSYPVAGSGNYQATVPVVDGGNTAIVASGSGRMVLGSATASLRVAGVARQTLMSSLTAATALLSAGAARSVLGSTPGTLNVAGVARQVLMAGTASSGRRRQLINPC